MLRTAAEQVRVAPRLTPSHTHMYTQTPRREGSYSHNYSPATTVGSGAAAGGNSGEPHSGSRGTVHWRELKINHPRATTGPNNRLNMTNDEAVLWWGCVRNVQPSLLYQSKALSQV